MCVFELTRYWPFSFSRRYLCMFACCFQVVSMVDFLLQTQDLNQDGLLALSELLSPSITHTQVLQMYWKYC